MAQMFADNKPAEGFCLFRTNVAFGRRSRQRRRYVASEIKDMPVSRASVQELQRFLALFTTGESAANARVLLAQQQTQLQDPTFRVRSEGLAAVKNDNPPCRGQFTAGRTGRCPDSDAVGALGQPIRSVATEPVPSHS